MTDMRKLTQELLKDRVPTRNIRDVLTKQHGMTKSQANSVIKRERKKAGIEGRRS